MKWGAKVIPVSRFLFYGLFGTFVWTSFMGMLMLNCSGGLWRWTFSVSVGKKTHTQQSKFWLLLWQRNEALMPRHIGINVFFCQWKLLNRLWERSSLQIKEQFFRALFILNIHLSVSPLCAGERNLSSSYIRAKFCVFPVSPNDFGSGMVSNLSILFCWVRVSAWG